MARQEFLEVVDLGGLVMYFIITAIAHLFGSCSEHPGGRDKGKCWVCRKDIEEEK